MATGSSKSEWNYYSSSWAKQKSFAIYGPVKVEHSGGHFNRGKWRNESVTSMI